MTSQLLEVITLLLGVLSTCLGGLRWLRVAQREHYLPGATLRFARRWWGSTPLNVALAALGTAGAVASVQWPAAALATAGAVSVGPLGLSLRGRTSRLAWTTRLRRLALLSTALATALVGLVAIAGLHPALTAAAFSALGAPLVIGVALALLKPFEARLLRPYVQKAQERLQAVSPKVVAVTGSYGKTTTKGYIAHLLGESLRVVATPASFNNTPGLARAINENLATGSQVFIAEMGTYGPGEIAAMCKWVPPDIAVITALGPVHLERMGSIERIAAAKAEILEHAPVAVVNVDHPLLAEVAKRAEEKGKSVWRCSGGQGTDGTPAPDVSALYEGTKLRVRASRLPGTLSQPGQAPRQQGPAGLDLLVECAPSAMPSNVACAVAVALCLGVPEHQVASRLADLPVAPHRRSIGRGTNGATVIDDTYNANPAGAKAALELLATATGKRVVVTPGMVELGPLQARKNADFAAEAGSVATLLVIVGLTNAKDLEAGARACGLATLRARNREEAVAWVSANLGPGDAVLYENDLPDHYP
ncbi:MAG: Mur ligase family protein [Acidimicrobiales bacterium]